MPNFNAYLVERAGDEVQGRLTSIDLERLPPGEVVIEVAWSSLNYKDALAAAGHPGVAGELPHVPGIDAAGKVVESQDPTLEPGRPVLVTGYELGAGRWGGWSQRIRVPAEWVIPIPEALTAHDTMAYGTAGFTAAQCLLKLQQADVRPDHGPIVVSGATGGVGCLAVALLHRCGYEVVASTGKADAREWLLELGASEVVSREEILNAPDRPLSRSRWGGAVDTVGGETLASILRATHLHGAVTACGLVGGDGLPTSVYPFILRGVTLSGVTSQNCPRDLRLKIWNQFAGDWKLDLPPSLVRSVPLSEIEVELDAIRRGAIRGRVTVDVNA